MSLDYSNIIPECYVDTNLIQYLLNGTVNHQHSCNNVIKVLKGKFKDRFAIGIIDNDKKAVWYLSECEKIVSSPHLCVLKHRERSHYLITITPAVDRFLLDCANEQGVSLKAHGFPSQLNEFIKLTKKVTSNTDPEIRRLIEDLRNHQELVSLQRTLDYLFNKTYNSDSSVIQSFFGCLL